MTDATDTMVIARAEMRRIRAVMRLQSRCIRRERRFRNLACGLSFVQSAAIAAVLLASCTDKPKLIEVAPICEIVIDHAHGTSETSGDCDAGEW